MYLFLYAGTRACARYVCVRVCMCACTHARMQVPVITHLISDYPHANSTNIAQSMLHRFSLQASEVCKLSWTVSQLPFFFLCLWTVLPLYFSSLSLSLSLFIRCILGFSMVVDDNRKFSELHELVSFACFVWFMRKTKCLAFRMFLCPTSTGIKVSFLFFWSIFTELCWSLSKLLRLNLC